MFCSFLQVKHFVQNNTLHFKRRFILLIAIFEANSTNADESTYLMNVPFALHKIAC